MRGRPCGAFSKSVGHASSPSDLSDKSLAAKDVIGENHPASDLSLGKDAPALETSPKNNKKFFDGFFLETPSYLLGDLERSPVFRERDRCSLHREIL